MATHTPGPWRTNRGGVEGLCNEPICAGQFNTSNGVTLEQCNANLRLIAAAPELLEALQKLCMVAEEFKSNDANAREWAKGLLVNARKAICKATT